MKTSIRLLQVFLKMVWWATIVYFVFTIIRFITVSECSLQQLNVLFRHGDRTPDLISMYPKDPHLNDSYYPDGLGALTMRGKMQEYDIGRYLRNTYDEFLGEIYTPDVMDAWSTDYNRTKMSLLATMAGLWPPAPSQIWDSMLMWQPIPFNYVSMATDEILRYAPAYCQKYQEEFGNVMQNEEMQEFLSYHAELISYLNINTGLNCKTTFDLFKLYFGLYAEEQTGRKIPEWTKKIYPDFLREATLMEYRFETYNDVLKRKGNGPLLKRMIGNAKAKMEETFELNDRRIYLYSAHEFNIAHMMASLNVYKPHIPPYAAFFILEFHKIHNQFGFKILYQDYSNLEPNVLTIPGCEEFCPFDKFVEITKNIVPEDNEVVC